MCEKERERERENVSICFVGNGKLTYLHIYNFLVMLKHFKWAA